jgi:epoxide hydrolase 4
MLSSYEDVYIETNGVRLHAVQAGPPDGPLVVLLHGFPEFWYGWERQIGPLAQAGLRLLVPDQRGYNLSDKPKGTAAYHIDLLALDIVGLIQAAGREKALIVGHDWGAAVGWQLATFYPQWVEKLAILNVPHPAVMNRALRRSPSQFRKSWYMFFFQIPGLPERLLRRDNWQPLADSLLKTSRPGAFSQEDLARYREAWSQPGAMTGMLNWYRQVIRSGFGYVFKPMPLPCITVPTLMLWGKQDFALDWRLAQPSIDLCVNKELIIFDDATHWVQHEQAERVNPLLLDFMKGLKYQICLKR